MKTSTVVISLGVHVAVAGFLLSRAETNQRHRAISVAVTDSKPKKPENRPKPVPPPPPKRIAKVAPTPVQAAPEAAAPRASMKAAPVQTAVALSNADLVAGGIALPGTPKVAAKPVRVGSISPEGPSHKANRPQAEDCDEEPTKPEAIYKTEIEYTAAARAENVEGRLVLQLTIAADGSVSDVDVVSSVEPALDASAVATVRRWRFKPAMKCGRPVSGGVYKLAQRFELTD